MDASAYMRSLCQSMSKSKLAHRGIELILTERSVRLDSERCWILGMIISGGSPMLRATHLARLEEQLGRTFVYRGFD